jgi:hypothetical protein
MSRRCGPVPVAMIAALLLSACHYNPYRWPRPGQPSATALENQLNERDSLQDAANDLIAVAAAMRDAVQRAYPTTQWAPISDGVQANCAPPFVFLTGKVYVLPRWQSPAPTSAPDAEAVVRAAADVLEAHHAEKIDPIAGQSVSGELPREHGKLQLTIAVPVNPQQPRNMAMTGTTGCHHAAPGPGPWSTPGRSAPMPGNTPPAPTPPPENTPTLTPPP